MCSEVASGTDTTGDGQGRLGTKASMGRRNAACPDTAHGHRALYGDLEPYPLLGAVHGHGSRTPAL